MKKAYPQTQGRWDETAKMQGSHTAGKTRLKMEVLNLAMVFDDWETRVVEEVNETSRSKALRIRSGWKHRGQLGTEFEFSQATNFTLRVCNMCCKPLAPI